MMTLFISAFLLGLIFNASPGAVFAESLKRGLSGGYDAALKVQFGSLVGDATWAVLGLAGAGVLFQWPTIRMPLTICGAAYLAWLGATTLMSTPNRTETMDGTGEPAGNQGALFAGASLSLTNPANVFYWAALGGVLGTLGVNQPTTAHYSVFFAGFMTSSLLWCFVCAGLIHAMHRTLPTAVAHWLNLLCGWTLIGLAVSTVYEQF
ncbi:LysE family translocator [Leptothrix discophora]|uniref:LysE family transporter n=1 Tax=Leptothrix discophora TaxID=89 RepID=A0ABT9G2W8_LEPDI|nr:LysE family transporter [Leptothrix discophora]MDP4300832.1 LysE family transporter [Leptothrix discophora]